MALTHVLTPIRLGPVEVPNRVVRTAHGTHFATTEITDQFIAYHEARARGGCGLTILEIASVHPSSVLTVRNMDDTIIPGYRKLMQAIAPHGMRVFQQLHHGGAHAPGFDGVPWSASAMTGPLGMVPIAMSGSQIEEVVAAFAAAAVRCREGGLDGVEIHAGHGYLFQQFLAAATNHREDAYGGSIDNRMRLLLDTVRAVRAAVGQDFAVGVRMSSSEVPGGVTHDEAGAALRALEAETLIDFADISVGDYYRMATMNATMESPAGYELPAAMPLTAIATVPTIVAGRFRTLEEADAVIREGVADMVSMVRAQIADPDLVAKTRAGHPERVRPCIGCNQGCIGGVMRGGQLGCLVNPDVGREAGALPVTSSAPVAAPSTLLVVGAGPAGLEAARTAASAGRHVILAEAQPQLGGMGYVAARAPFQQGFGDLLAWYESEIYRLGVDVRLGTYVENDALPGDPDAVIVATGSWPRMDGVQAMTPWLVPGGVDQPHVLSSVDLVMERRETWGRNAVVLDDTGGYEAIAAIDVLMSHGVAVTYVSRFAMMTPQAEFSQRTIPALERFGRGEFTPLLRHALTAIEPDRVVVRPLHGGSPREIAADHVVLVTPNQPVADVFAGLPPGLPRWLVGDARSPRDMQAAIAEGRAAAVAFMSQEHAAAQKEFA